MEYKAILKDTQSNFTTTVTAGTKAEIMDKVRKIQEHYVLELVYVSKMPTT